MLRIDVNGTSGSKHYRIPASNPYVGRSGRDEIWLRGLRNPWRFSFDRGDRAACGSATSARGGTRRSTAISMARKGANLGLAAWWRATPATTRRSGCNKAGNVKPILAYSHAGGRCAVTGGYVYRGSNIPALVGWYVFGDFCSGEIWAVSSTRRHAREQGPARATRADSISSFGENASGELFVVDLGGTIYRIDHG